MRDQINGQLYDVVMTDCDVKDFLMGFGKECGFGECRGACDVCHDDDYAHRIIPATEGAAYDSYEDKLTE